MAPTMSTARCRCAFSLASTGSGFCREKLMASYEAHRVGGYVVGFARDERLRKRISLRMAEAAWMQQASGRNGG